MHESIMGTPKRKIWDKFIACAITSKSNVIVSVDKHLLKISGFRGINILKPREFVDIFLK